MWLFPLSPAWLNCPFTSNHSSPACSATSGSAAEIAPAELGQACCALPLALCKLSTCQEELFLLELYMLEPILYIYIYVFIWCWQLENAYGAAEIVSNSWTIFLLEYRAYLHHVSNCVSVLLHWRKICRRAMVFLGKPMVSTSFSQNNYFIHQSPTNRFNTDITYQMHISYSWLQNSKSPLNKIILIVNFWNPFGWDHDMYLIDSPWFCWVSDGF